MVFYKFFMLVGMLFPREIGRNLTMKLFGVMLNELTTQIQERVKSSKFPGPVESLALDSGVVPNPAFHPHPQGC